MKPIHYILLALLPGGFALLLFHHLRKKRERYETLKREWKSTIHIPKSPTLTRHLDAQLSTEEDFLIAHQRNLCHKFGHHQ